MSPRPFPLEQALRRHVHALAVEIGPRAPFLGNSLERAAAYIEETLRGFGLRIERQRFAFEGIEVANLLAWTPGVAPGGRYWLVGAHYDSVATSPGADDNASAVAVLLELAGRFAESRIPICFAAFTLEEPPVHMTLRQGSRVFVRALGRDRHRVRGAVILEMVGYTAPRQRYPLLLGWLGYPQRGDFIGIIADMRSRRFARRILEAFRSNPDLPAEWLVVPFRGWLLPDVRLSDHAPFWDAGIPAVMVTDTAFYRNPHYHQPSDTIDTLDFGFMARLVESLSIALTELGI